jgi:hypothetical protein
LFEKSAGPRNQRLGPSDPNGMMRPLRLRSAFLLLLAVAPAGCISAGGEGDEQAGPPPTLKRSTICERTACAASRERCETKRSECTDTCSHGRIEDASLCFDVCRNIECEPCGARDGSPCVQEGYQFSVTGVQVAAVESACERYARHLATCENEPPRLACETLSRTARPALGSSLDCAASRACGDTASCFDDLPISDLGQAVCGVIQERCPLERCSEALIARLDQIGRWLRDDASVAALDCASEPCSSIQACLAAWSEAIS